jgi:L-alanine-DL-glutamate epimerase-like enolase superfamily enzyme
MLDRRHFIAAGSASLLALSAGWSRAERRTLGRLRERLKITAIESHEIYLPYHEFNARNLWRYHGGRIRARTIHVVKTNIGLTGFGENWGTNSLKAEELAAYIGTSPFDWINDTRLLQLNIAIYDLMGKALDVPAWKLIGPQVRDRVPVSAWTVSLPPAAMALEVKQAERLGYRWLKYHVDQVQNVEDQVAAMEQVASDGFQLHLDLNMNSPYEQIGELLGRLDKRTIVGRLEDPITATDPAMWRRLQDELETPIVAHHGPRDFIQLGVCDGYMAGHSPIGQAVRTAAIAEAAELPIMLQQCGGQLNQAFLAHEAAVFPAATMDHVNLAHLWREDITDRVLAIEDGTIAVPDGPGLGINVDLRKLEHHAQTAAPEYEPFLVRIRYQQGPTIYCRHDANQSGHTDDLRFLARLLGEPIPGPAPRYDNAVSSSFLDAADGEEFEKYWAATEKRKYVLA